MALLDELPFVLPPEMALAYRASWPSSDLLAEAMTALAPDASVLVLGGAADPLALTLARRVPRGACVVVEDDAAASDRLTQVAAQTHLSSLRVVDPAELAMGAATALGGRFDACLANIMFHPSKVMTLHLLRLGCFFMRAGATMYVAGAKDRGMPSIAEELRRLFGTASVVAMRKGHRVAAAVRRNDPQASEPLWPEPRDGAVEVVRVRGERYTLVASPLVFAGGRLDPATALLAEACHVAPDDIVVDLGSGSGIVGLVAARLAERGHVYLLDASHAAVRTGLANAERNGISNVTALVGDGPASMAKAALRPNVVLTNPPFHAGQVEARQVADRFIAAAAAHLAPDGRLYLVANRFLSYEPRMGDAFESVREVAQDQRYKVLLAELPLR